MATINERIRELRLRRGLTLVEVADVVGVREATIQRYESGSIKNISHEAICKMAILFRCSPSYLMGWDDTPPELELSPLEEKLVRKFRTLSTDERNMILRSMGIEEKGDEVIEDAG